MPLVGAILAFIEGISYELYLAHVIALDYLKVHHNVGALCVYAVVTIIGLLVLILLKNWIQKLKESHMK